MNTDTERGSYTQEAALILPLFILAIMTLAFTIRIIGVGGAVMHGAADEGRRLALESYKGTGIFLFEDRLTKRLLEECPDITSVRIGEVGYLYEKGAMDNLISYSIATEVDLPLPFPIEKEFPLRHRVLCRGWVGKERNGSPMAFSDMEKDGDSRKVWVFPRTGTHYHGEACTYVNAAPITMVLTDDLEGKYSPCARCRAESIPHGSLVYCFPEYGEAYHRASCDSVDRYVASMDEEDAKAKGYAPCSKCGGY